MHQLANAEFEEKQQHEYEAAAREAAKDLDPDLALEDQQSQEQIGEQQTIEDPEKEVAGQVANSVSKQGSLVDVMRRGSIHSLAATGSGLDSLIGASSALEVIGGDDPEYLKRYSERIAMEAEESEKSSKEEEQQIQQMQRLLSKQEQEPEVNQEDSVEHARLMAA